MPSNSGSPLEAHDSPGWLQWASGYFQLPQKAEGERNARVT